MKLKQLIDTTSFNDIWNVLICHYPGEENNKKSYIDVFNKLKTMDPKISDMRIIIDRQYDEIHKKVYHEDLWFYDIHGSNGSLLKDDPDFNFYSHPEKEKIGNEEIRYGLDFTPWNEWLGMDINNATLTKFTNAEILAHSLFEITFCGFDETNIQQKLSEIKSNVDEIKNLTDEQIKERTISLDSFKKELYTKHPEIFDDIQ